MLLLHETLQKSQWLGNPYQISTPSLKTVILFDYYLFRKKKMNLKSLFFLYYFRYYHNAKQFANVSGQKYNFVCSICSETITIKNINSHGCKLTAKKHFECPFCTREFQMQAQLDVHLSNGWCKEMQKTKSVEESRKVYKVRFEKILGVIYIIVSPLFVRIHNWVLWKSFMSHMWVLYDSYLSFLWVITLICESIYEFHVKPLWFIWVLLWITCKPFRSHIWAPFHVLSGSL